MADKLCARQFRLFIVRPVLQRLDQVVPYSVAAEDMLVGTALYESGLDRFDQWLGTGDEQLGPAYGLYQIEEPTHADLWDHFLTYRPQLRDKVLALRAPWPSAEVQLATNLAYATAVARCLYYRAPQLLPAAGDVDAYGAYYKAHYNTPLGAGSATAWAETYRKLAA